MKGIRPTDYSVRREMMQVYNMGITDGNVHETSASCRRIQEAVAVINVPRSCE